MRMPGFIGGFNTSESVMAGNEALINWYIEPIGENRFALFPTPGVRSRVEFPTAGGRAAIDEVFENWTYTARGTVAIDSHPASMCSNGDGGQQLAICAGGNVYCYDLATDTLTLELTGPGYTHVGMLYGYFVAFKKTSTSVQIEISDLFDGTTWDPTQFAARTIGADSWQAMLVDPYGYMFLPGSKTGEHWYNAGSSPFPFAPDQSGLIEEGIAAPFSLKQAGKSKVWLSTNANGGYQVMRAQGFTPQRISTHALEQQISTYGDVSDAFGETYEDKGHAFYLLTFPSVPITWVYNFGTNQWHQQGTWISEDNRFTYWRPAVHVFGFSKHLALDRETNALYEVGASFATDVDDRPMRRVRRTPAQTNENKLLFFDSLEIHLETGVGLITGDAEDTDPVVMLRASDDHGRTWGPERQMSAGRTGQYQTRVQAWGLGAARGRVYEVSVSAAVPWRVVDAYQKVRGSQEVA
jgi:hypothetical protein